VADSMRIVSWLERRRPDPPLWPASLGRRAEVDVFVEWFNRVWKVPPNAMAAELASPAPDQQRLHALSDELRGWLHLFEEMLGGRDWLMGESFGAADVCAFPFLKYGVLELRPDDADPFHRVLSEHLPIAGAFPEIEAWVNQDRRTARASGPFVVLRAVDPPRSTCAGPRLRPTRGASRMTPPAYGGVRCSERRCV
jgi:glutathione S-transferase